MNKPRPLGYAHFEHHHIGQLMSSRVLCVGDQPESGGKRKEGADGVEMGEERAAIDNGEVGTEEESEIEGEEEVLYETSSHEQLESTGGSVDSDGSWEERYRGMARQCEQLKEQRDALAQQLAVATNTERQKDQSYQEIAKELELKCFSQQEQLDSLQEQLDQEKERAESKQLTLEKELALRVDQVTKMYETVMKEKDGLVAKLGTEEGETKKLKEQLASEREATSTAGKESERLQAQLKKQRTELAKAQASSEKHEARAGEQSRELSRLKEEMSSLNIKLKWAQNKLQAETEAHKETKSQLLTSNKKQKQAREEGEQIRSDLKNMITQYQESEEMRSNSLDVQLKKTEKELKAHEQEIADQQELHELTVKELELVKTAHTIAMDECQQLKSKLSEQTGKLGEVTAEAEELRGVVKKLREEKEKLTTEVSSLEHVNHTMENEKQKLSTLRENYGQLQRSYQHLEKDLSKRKERESELLSLTEKLSSANAELQAERSSWDTKVSSLAEECATLSSSLAETQERRKTLENDLEEMREESHSQISHLMDSLEHKSKAVEQLSMALEDEREQIKALKKKHTSSTKDLQRQIQYCKRRIEHLETQIPTDQEAPATLPITEGSRASSHSSIDALPPSTITTHHRTASPEEEPRDRAGSPALPSEMFQTLDQEKLVLVEKICSLKRQLARCEEKMEFFESHSHQLTEDIQKKSKIIQNFIMREQSGALAPPSHDQHKLRVSRKGGVMASVFSGVRHHHHDVNLELSLEMNRKMQSVLEDTLLKNITLKESIDTLGQEIQRLSTQLQAYENSSR